MPTILVEGLNKRYGEFQAVKDVTFSVERGEVFALLGPNGAGKTTTIEILEGFRRRDSGHVEVLGFDPADESNSRALRERMGIVLQELAVEPLLTVREVLSRNAAYYRNPRPIDEVLEQIGLADRARARVKTLSGGQQRRLDLALGIVGNPDIMFLDEPTTGFDPSARRAAWELVQSLTGGGTTVILTTHYMEEADVLADRVAVIARGEIVAIGPTDSIGGRDLGDVRIRFRLPDAVAIDEVPVGPVEVVNGVVEVTTDREVEQLHRLTGWALERGIALIGLSVERLTLEDVYLRLTGEPREGSISGGDERLGRQVADAGRRVGGARWRSPSVPS